jgi:hypothetical protein
MITVPKPKQPPLQIPSEKSSQPIRLSFTPTTTTPMGPPKQATKLNLKRSHAAIDKTPVSNADGQPPRKILKLKVNPFKVQEIQRSSPHPVALSRAPSTSSRSSPAPRFSPAPVPAITPHPAPLSHSASPLDSSTSPAPFSASAPGQLVVKARKPLPDSAPSPPSLSTPPVKKRSIVLKLKDPSLKPS